MNKLIILSGKAQSGKDTSAEYFIDLLGNNVCKRYSFATPLKEFIHRVFAIHKDWLWGTDAQKNNYTHIRWADLPLPVDQINFLVKDLHVESEYLTARHLMMIFGSEICRRMYGDCWVHATYNDIINDNKEYSFITDARFPNEISFFKDKPLHTLIIRLSRNILNKKHISETALDEFDWLQESNYGAFIDNKSTSLLEKNSLLNHVSCMFDYLCDDQAKALFAKLSKNSVKIRSEASLREHILYTTMWFKHKEQVYLFDAKLGYDNFIAGEINNTRVYQLDN